MCTPCSISRELCTGMKLLLFLATGFTSTPLVSEPTITAPFSRTRNWAERVLRDASQGATKAQDPATYESAAALLSDTLAPGSDFGVPALLRQASEAAAKESAASDHETYPDELTEREVEVLLLVAKGRSNRDISDELFITVNTVANHVKKILSKTHSANRTEAAAYAKEKGLV